MELLAFVPLAFMIRSDYKERVIRIYPLLFFGILTVTGSVHIPEHTRSLSGSL